MKKLIAIAVVFALVAGAAFAADLSTGGAIKADALNGNSEDDGMAAGNWSSWFWFSVQIKNDENTAGAKAGLSINPNDASAINNAGDTYAYAFWQPIQQLYIKLGKLGEDGKYWAGAGVTGWDFQSNDLLLSPAFGYYNGYSGSILADSHGFFSNGFAEEAKYAAQVSLLPVEGLALNAGIDLKGGTAKHAYLDSLALQLVYDIAALGGQAAVGFKNGNGDKEKGDLEDKHLYVQYKMPINDGMKIEAGVHFPIAVEDGYKSPLDIGLGFGYGSPWGDTFWLTVRAGVAIPMEEHDVTRIGFDICPSYDVGIFRLYVPVGIATILPEEGDSIFAWSLNPYIRKSMGPVEFWIGLKLYNGGVNGEGGNYYPQVIGELSGKPANEVVSFSVPLAFLWSF